LSSEKNISGEFRAAARFSDGVIRAEADLLNVRNAHSNADAVRRLDHGMVSWKAQKGVERGKYMG
jgi:hypothetical protein